MEDKKNNTKFYTFGRYQSSALDFKEIIDRKEWASFGKNNDFPQELIRLYHTASPLHTALIDKIALMTAGKGFKKILNQTIKEKLFLQNRFSKDNLDIIASKSSFDLALSRLFYLNIVWDEKGENIAKIDHIPFEKVRAAKLVDDASQEGYYVSRDWLDIRKAINKPKWYPAFSQETAKGELKSQILAVMVYTPGMEYYTLPGYKSSLDSIKCNYELNLFHLKSIQLGFTGGMVIIQKGHYTPEEQDELYNDIKSKYSGADSAGDFIMIFAETEEAVPEIKPIELQATDQRYLDLKESITSDILQGHSATSPVGGKETSGKLGTADEIIDAHKMFNLTVIQPYQKVINDVINKLASYNGIETHFELESFDYSNLNTVKTEGGSETKSNISASPTVKNEEDIAKANLKGSVGGGSRNNSNSNSCSTRIK